MSRVPLALNGDYVDAAVDVYSKLFGTTPAKLRPGYANFAVANPPLKLVLFEQPGNGGTINHLVGVEVECPELVDAAHARLATEGMLTATQKGVACCYARQDNVWVDGPSGEHSEIYTVLADVEMLVCQLRTVHPESGAVCFATTTDDAHDRRRRPRRGVGPSLKTACPVQKA